MNPWTRSTGRGAAALLSSVLMKFPSVSQLRMAETGLRGALAPLRFVTHSMSAALLPFDFARIRVLELSGNAITEIDENSLKPQVVAIDKNPYLRSDPESGRKLIGAVVDCLSAVEAAPLSAIPLPLNSLTFKPSAWFNLTSSVGVIRSVSLQDGEFECTSPCDVGKAIDPHFLPEAMCRCRSGFFGSGTHCQVCPPNHFSVAGQNAGACTSCPENSHFESSEGYSDVFADSVEVCACLPGFEKVSVGRLHTCSPPCRPGFHYPKPPYVDGWGGEVCERCENTEALECPGRVWGKGWAKSGFWATDRGGRTVVVRCTVASACLGQQRTAYTSWYEDEMAAASRAKKRKRKLKSVRESDEAEFLGEMEVRQCRPGMSGIACGRCFSEADGVGWKEEWRKKKGEKSSRECCTGANERVGNQEEWCIDCGHWSRNRPQEECRQCGEVWWASLQIVGVGFVNALLLFGQAALANGARSPVFSVMVKLFLNHLWVIKLFASELWVSYSSLRGNRSLSLQESLESFANLWDGQVVGFHSSVDCILSKHFAVSAPKRILLVRVIWFLLPACLLCFFLGLGACCVFLPRFSLWKRRKSNLGEERRGDVHTQGTFLAAPGDTSFQVGGESDPATEMVPPTGWKGGEDFFSETQPKQAGGMAFCEELNGMSNSASGNEDASSLAGPMSPMVARLFGQISSSFSFSWKSDASDVVGNSGEGETACMADRGGLVHTASRPFNHCPDVTVGCDGGIGLNQGDRETTCENVGSSATAADRGATWCSEMPSSDWGLAKTKAFSQMIERFRPLYLFSCPYVLGIWRKVPPFIQPVLWKRVRLFFADSQRLLLVLLNMTYLGVAAHVFALVQCETSPVGEPGSGSQGELTKTWRWVHDPELRCFTFDHIIWLTSGLIGLLVFLLIPWAIILRTFWHDRTSLHRLELRQQIGFFFYGYRPQFFLWELTIFVRKLSALLVSVIPVHDPARRLGLWMVLAVVSLAAQVGFMPYTREQGNLLNKVETLTLAAWVVSLWLGLLLLQAATPEEANGLGGMLLTLNVVVVGVCVCALLRALLLQAESGRISKPKKKTTGNGAHVVLADSLLPSHTSPSPESLSCRNVCNFFQTLSRVSIVILSSILEIPGIAFRSRFSVSLDTGGTGNLIVFREGGGACLPFRKPPKSSNLRNRRLSRVSNWRAQRAADKFCLEVSRRLSASGLFLDASDPTLMHLSRRFPFYWVFKRQDFVEHQLPLFLGGCFGGGEKEDREIKVVRRYVTNVADLVSELRKRILELMKSAPSDVATFLETTSGVWSSASTFSRFTCSTASMTACVQESLLSPEGGRGRGGCNRHEVLAGFSRCRAAESCRSSICSHLSPEDSITAVYSFIDLRDALRPLRESEDEGGSLKCVREANARFQSTTLCLSRGWRSVHMDLRLTISLRLWGMWDLKILSWLCLSCSGSRLQNSGGSFMPVGLHGSPSVTLTIHR
uniref:EGF-like domain-containing protein n=1 Tax=Chromera velia CCMP2878 TaxID=1169474 RepID=A0A0G4FLQ7_9ALVE|eukprot:Cvel_17664.t1-p1 / transcript=Cvel_17664.t1 / gene=Cvel_17664 / organism=Chromera_velia_CCMP2878 / gene_product=hypothetical protein / transcript_product=hypothetical protein / location=Cvel_scaffold1423:12807-18602(-) / protein_length=1467 / sequence_SO=supercontig / SO=protein_coding / is_pseudo=false